MDTKKATAEYLALIHKKYAEYLDSLLNDAVKVDTKGKPIGIPLDAATLGNIRGFLKDNEITCDPISNDTLEDLRAKYAKASNGIKSNNSNSLISDIKKQEDQFNSNMSKLLN